MQTNKKFIKSSASCDVRIFYTISVLLAFAVIIKLLLSSSQAGSYLYGDHRAGLFQSL